MGVVTIIITIAGYWIVTSLLFGIGEAYYAFHLNQAKDKRGRKSDHAYANLLRLLVAMPLLAWMNSLEMTFVTIALMGAYMVLSFPYIHDGILYQTTNLLSPGTYIGGWQADVDGRAYFDLTYKQRLLCFCTAILLCVGMIIIELL